MLPNHLICTKSCPQNYHNFMTPNSCIQSGGKHLGMVAMDATSAGSNVVFCDAFTASLVCCNDDGDKSLCED